ncbi:MAG: hypothetical protein QOG41_2149 [Thermoleophilaceae bacterium]|jgi:hypothetical protein|nr:hypothetical protein [Thermoleophilaceae bacterium]MEA2350294.1 hypothetical protein [Thermoleophilaceae bacterium]MEA2352965.1 hypothetical protein [Thermoleophilaceae bacterium]MEA2368314.1 hypothetical protein [Thermoleophilaceae bacterium]MEA2389376.1 hypothetical protein [Thermoleophilaceae bacterium]
MRLRNIIVGALLSTALFVAAAPAYAQTAAQNGYSEPAGSVQQQLGSSGNDGHKVAASNVSQNGGDSKLPFTGLDIALVVAAGGVLLAMGLGIRRLSRAEVA